MRFRSECVFYIEDFDTSHEALNEKNVRLQQNDFIQYGDADFIDPEDNVSQIVKITRQIMVCITYKNTRDDDSRTTWLTFTSSQNSA